MPMIDTYRRVTQNRTIVRGHFARPHIPSPSMNDYRRGFIIRYFAKPRNNSKGMVVEIDKKQFDSHPNRAGGLQREYYSVASLRWKITGSMEEIQDANAKSVDNADRNMRGLTLKLGNLLQFAKIS